LREVFGLVCGCFGGGGGVLNEGTECIFLSCSPFIAEDALEVFIYLLYYHAQHSIQLFYVTSFDLHPGHRTYTQPRTYEKMTVWFFVKF